MSTSIAARTSLASVLCPSTPFLLPRLARTAVPRSTLHLPITAPNGITGTHVHYRLKSSAKPRRSLRSKLSRVPKITAHDAQQNEDIGIFLQVCKIGSIDQIVAMYPTVAGSPHLQRDHTRQIAAVLHHKIRTDKTASRSEKLMLFVERIILDIKSETLPPHPAAHVHLLGIFKTTGRYGQGRAFWQWLTQQGGGYADAAVYGAAIELLAYEGSTNLADLEKLYATALKRFPGTFAEYHLSPEAIIADKTAPTMIAGLPITLLQGITTARIFSRDWRQSYLALDTALRLYPTSTPGRFFELFMYERPTAEVYTVFIMACRSGVVLKPDQLTNLLRNLVKPMDLSSDLTERVAILRSMAHSIYAYLETGGHLEGPILGAFLAAFTRLLPRRESSADYVGSEAVIRDTMIATALEIAKLLTSAGLRQVPQAITGLAAVANALKSSALLETVVKDIGPRIDDIGDVGRRHIMLAAGRLGKVSLMETYWNHIVRTAEKHGKQLEYSSWITLARACRSANSPGFVHDQLIKLSHTLSADVEDAVKRELDAESPRPQETAFVAMPPEVFDTHMGKLKEQIQDIATIVMSKQPLDMQRSPLFLHIDPTRLPLASTADLHSVYLELNTDPHQLQPVGDGTSTQNRVYKSATGIPLDELRFQNWVTILELMHEAEAVERDFQKRLNKAIADGRKWQHSPDPVKFHNPDQLRQVAEVADEAREVIFTEKAQLRQRIMELRAPPVVAEQHRWVRSEKTTHALKNSIFTPKPVYQAKSELASVPGKAEPEPKPVVFQEDDAYAELMKLASNDPNDKSLNLLSRRRQYKRPQAANVAASD